MSKKNEIICCHSIIFISDSVNGNFLSFETKVDLIIVNRNFSTVGFQLSHQHSKVVANLNQKDQSKLNSQKITCSCQTRSKLQFKATSENVSKVREWLLQRYAASTFNTCSHKPVNQMSAPRLKFI